MNTLPELFENNRRWADAVRTGQPDFFPQLARQQSPKYLWIGCSDSRVPANQLLGMEPGELFVHRNVANVVVHTDLNCLSVIHFAVEALMVEHIIVCGHYHCGGVRAALEDGRLGLIDNWLRHIQDVAHKHAAQLDAIDDFDRRCSRLCELNVIEQVVNVCRTTIVQDAWRRQRPLTVHGWIYDVHDGLLNDLGISVADPQNIAALQDAAASPT